MSDQNIQDILEENARRKQEADSIFDPISGLGSTGRRFHFKVRGLDEMWLPEPMHSEPDVRDLLDLGSLDDLLQRRLGRHITQRDHENGALRFRRLRMLHDFPYWAASCAYIKNKSGGDDMLFHLNRPQRRLVEKFEEMRTAGRPIRLILLKARQWGGSTCSQLYMAWLQLVHRQGLNSLIIAHQGVGSDEI